MNASAPPSQKIESPMHPTNSFLQPNTHLFNHSTQPHNLTNLSKSSNPMTTNPMTTYVFLKVTNSDGDTHSNDICEPVSVEVGGVSPSCEILQAKATSMCVERLNKLASNGACHSYTKNGESFKYGQDGWIVQIGNYKHVTLSSKFQVQPHCQWLAAWCSDCKIEHGQPVSTIWIRHIRQFSYSEATQYVNEVLCSEKEKRRNETSENRVYTESDDAKLLVELLVYNADECPSDKAELVQLATNKLYSTFLNTIIERGYVSPLQKSRVVDDDVAFTVVRAQVI